MTSRRKLGKGEEKEPKEAKESEIELEEEIEEVAVESEIAEENTEVAPEQPVEEAVQEEPKEEIRMFYRGILSELRKNSFLKPGRIWTEEIFTHQQAVL